MGCKHNFRYTQGHFYCIRCGKTTYGYDHYSKEVLAVRKKKTGLVFLCLIVAFCSLSVIGTSLAGSDNYLDVELSMLFYYGILQDVTDQTNMESIMEIIENQDTTKVITYIDEKGAIVKDSLKTKRINDENRRLAEEAKREKEEKAEKREIEREYEVLIHAYTNEYRAEHGLRPLQLSEEISTVARMHSQDMLDNGYFAHDNLKGQTPTDRGKLMGVLCVKDYGDHYTEGLGENLYYLPADYGVRENAKIIVDGWMQSKGHRENILDGNYNQIGIGVKFEGLEIYATQNFC